MPTAPTARERLARVADYQRNGFSEEDMVFLTAALTRALDALEQQGIGNNSYVGKHAQAALRDINALAAGGSDSAGRG